MITRILVSAAVAVGVTAVPLLVAQAVVASPASAHSALVSAQPALNATLGRMPSLVSLEFTDEMNAPSQISVLGPDGKKVGRGETMVKDNIVSREVLDPRQAGIYRVDYRVVSADGHPVSNSYKFTVTVGTPTSSKATSDPLRSEKQFRWFFVSFGVLASIIVAFYVSARFRSDGDG